MCRDYITTADVDMLRLCDIYDALLEADAQWQALEPLRQELRDRETPIRARTTEKVRDLWAGDQALRQHVSID